MPRRVYAWGGPSVGYTPPDPGGCFTKVMNSLFAPYSLPIRNIWTIKLFTNRKQIGFLNNKCIDLDWYYSKHNWKLKLIIRDLLFTTFVKNPTEADTHTTPTPPPPPPPVNRITDRCKKNYLPATTAEDGNKIIELNNGLFLDM